MIVAMNSANGEKVQFDKPVHCSGGVEKWLNSLLNMVRDTVKTVIAVQCQCFKEPDYDFIAGFVAFCGQVSTYYSLNLAKNLINRVPFMR